MAYNKKYYYLKLKDNFFDSEELIILETMENGYVYSNILLKMYLKSLRNDGKLLINDRIPYNPVLIAKVIRHNPNDVEKALQLGAVAVSVHVNIGSEKEPEMLKTTGKIAEECDKWGMPLLAMMYPRGPKIDDEHDPEVVKLAARAGAELGADIVKTNYTGDPDTFKEVVDGCPVPVIIAGGPKIETDLQLLQMVDEAIEVGGAGVAIGRNVFQSKDPAKTTRALVEIIHNRMSPEEALKIMEN